MTSNAPQDLGKPLVLEDHIPVEQPVSPDARGSCAVCHKTQNLLRCSGCKDILYCSRGCQTIDRSDHKSLCKGFDKFRRLNDMDNGRRALLLRPECEGARFHWLFLDENGRPDVQRCFRERTGQPANIKTIGFHDRFLPYWLQISYDCNPEQRRTLNDNSAAQHVLRGDVVVVAYDAVEGLSAPPLDVDTKSLRPVLEYLRLRAEYHGPIFIEQPQARYTEEQWRKIENKVNSGVPSSGVPLA